MATSNQTVVRRFFDELVNQRRYDRVNELIAPDLVIHTQVPGVRGGRDGFLAFLRLLLDAFPDQEATIDLLTEDGDLVTVLHTHRGVQDGPFLGLPPTGKRIEVQRVEIYRLRHGQIAELWHHDDLFTLFTQLGMVTPPTVAG
ncbi:MAG: hypothetical protein KatS3mg060_3667 [Dehalococcoidia bacterium]|nr:MAG: hypothetical protein KatS3mg060_3667 [Dehalococcoidia bacterium]